MATMRYQVRALESPGAVDIVELEWVADSESQVRAEAHQKGLSVLSVQPLKPAAAPKPLKWKSSDLAWWCKELHTLVSAGMTAVEALETLQVQMRARGAADARAAIQADLLEGLHRGLSLSQSMEKLGHFPTVLVASVRAAERTSALAGALQDYLRYYEVVDQMRRRVISAAMYPMLVAGVGFVVSLFLVTVVMPKFLGFMEGTQASRAAATSMLMAFSHWLNTHAAWAAGAGVACLLAVAWAWREGHVAAGLRWLALQIPPVARTIWAFEMTQLYQSLALLYRGGYPIEEAMDVCRAAAQGRQAALSSQLARCQQSLQRGQSLASSLAAAGLTDEVSARLLAVGERSGDLHGILLAIAQRHAQIVGDFVDRAMRVIEPLLLLLVASLVGAVVVMMYLPIFDLATGLRA